jgi:hypothetical protein
MPTTTCRHLSYVSVFELLAVAPSPTKLRKIDERPWKRLGGTIAFPTTDGVTMAQELECERAGAVIRGADDEELAARMERHIAEAHPDLVGTVSGEDILAAAEA